MRNTAVRIARITGRLHSGLRSGRLPSASLEPLLELPNCVDHLLRVRKVILPDGGRRLIAARRRPPELGATRDHAQLVNAELARSLKSEQFSVVSHVREYARWQESCRRGTAEMKGMKPPQPVS
jgi:hypothetical protein